MKYFLPFFVLIPLVAFGAPDPITTNAPEVTSDVSADLFNYFAWAAGIVILGLVLAIGVLWRSRGHSGLSVEQNAMLAWLKESHDQKTDGVFDWMIPKIWGEMLTNIAEAAKQQGDINDVRDRLEQEQTERREQVEALSVSKKISCRSQWKPISKLEQRSTTTTRFLTV